MKRKTNPYNLIFILLLVLLIGALSSNNVSAESDSLLVKQEVSNCNNDGTCDAWETFVSCPDDCPAPDDGQEDATSTINNKHKHHSVIITTPPISTPNNIKLQIKPGVNSVKILWNTAEDTISQVYWGRTHDYEKGSLSEVSFLKNHAVKIENLAASSKYFLKIIILNSAGRKTKIEGLSFKTLNPPDTEAPANVGNLQAQVFDNFILLSWENPMENDFEAVRIMKMEKFYPNDPLEGKVVYEGRGTRAEDWEIERGGTYYYSVFSRDKSGNYSSGAIISVMVGNKNSKTKEEISGKKQTQTKRNETKILLNNRETGGEKNIQKQPREAEIIKNEQQQKKKTSLNAPREKTKKTREQKNDITLFDFSFIQDGKKISFTGDRIKIQSNKKVKILVNANTVPKNTKKLIITLKKPKYPHGTHSFMLSLNNNVFSTVIPATNKQETYLLSIHFINANNKEFKQINGKIIFTLTQTRTAEKFVKSYNYVKKILKKIVSFLTNLLSYFYYIAKQAIIINKN